MIYYHIGERGSMCFVKIIQRFKEKRDMEKHAGAAGITQIKEYIDSYKNMHWQNIIIHHSKTKDAIEEDWESIRRYHTETLKWANIGYSFGIENINGVYKYMIGRPLDKAGAHTKEAGQNRVAIGIVLIGDFDKDPPTKVQYWLLASLCRHLCLVYNIPTAQIYPHNYFATYKSCPGTKFSMQTLIKTIRGRQ